MVDNSISFLSKGEKEEPSWLLLQRGDLSPLPLLQQHLQALFILQNFRSNLQALPALEIRQLTPAKDNHNHYKLQQIRANVLSIPFTVWAARMISGDFFSRKRPALWTKDHLNYSKHPCPPTHWSMSAEHFLTCSLTVPTLFPCSLPVSPSSFVVMVPAFLVS